MKLKHFTLAFCLLMIARFSDAQVLNCCATPVQIFETNITNTSAKINWFYATPTNCPNPIKFQIRYKTANAAAWQHANKPYIANGMYGKNLTNLLMGTGYLYQVRTQCGNSSGSISYSPWSPLADFMTLLKEGSFLSEPIASVFPNPGTDQLNMVLENVSAEVVTLTMMNLLGQPVSVQTWNQVDGLLNVDLNTAALPSGNYFVVLQFNDEQQVMKWVKE